MPRTQTANKTRKRAPARKKKPPYTARTADKHVLYQLSVQAPEREARFLSRYYEKLTGGRLALLREDFCGTALLSCWFVKIHGQNRAVGVDLHRPTLSWGRRHNVATLLDEGQRQRLELVCGDVLDVRRRAQAIAALNFSYSVFKTREVMLRYLRNCFQSLEPGGVLFLDDWGGPDVIKEEHTDRTRHKGFDYLWEQRSWDPIHHRIVCAIHFAFRDGTRMKDAFVYDWRLWTLPELRELMVEAGFTDVHVLWEGAAADGTGNGVFRRRERGEADDAWIVYVVGRKPG